MPRSEDVAHVTTGHVWDRLAREFAALFADVDERLACEQAEKEREAS